MAALIASFFTVFIKSTNPVKPYATAPVADSASTKGVETSANAADEVMLGEGLINTLQPNEDIQIADPHRPNKDCQPFLDLLLREVGAALEIPFEVLLQSFNASYSASKAALLEAWRYFMVKRAQLAGQDCQPAYELFFDECVASGRYSAPGYGDPLLRAAWTKANWIGPARGDLDETKAAQAATERISNGTSNESIECDERALDRDEVFTQRAYEIQTRREAGMMEEKQDGKQENTSASGNDGNTVADEPDSDQ
jgi:capsid protein